jgi:hypothetical protein
MPAEGTKREVAPGKPGETADVGEDRASLLRRIDGYVNDADSAIQKGLVEFPGDEDLLKRQKLVDELVALLEGAEPLVDDVGGKG